MTSSSSLTSGTVSTANGTSYISGISSGLDTTALIEAAVSQRTATADTIDAKVTANTAKVTAYTQMQTLLATLQTSLDALRNTDSANTTANVFTQNTAYVSSTGAVQASDLLGASADQTATPGTYTVEVDKVALAEKVSSTAVASASTTLGYTGSFVLGAGSSSTTISVTPDMSLTALQTLINSSSTSSGVSASIVHVSGSDSRLILTGTNTDQTITTSSVSGDDVMHDLGVTNPSGTIPTGQILQPAQEAEFQINGVPATRTTNNISDAIDGVTLNLYGASTGQSINLEISPNLTGIKSEIQTFVTAYNAYRSFIIAQQATASDGTASSTATLFGDSLLRQVNSAISSPLSQSLTASDGTLTSLSAIGISLDTNNNLTVDDTTLNSALSNNLSEVESLFEYQSTTSSNQLSVLRHGTGSISGSFTLDVTTDGSGNLTGASVDGDNSANFTVSGGRIIGNDGTAYAGMVLIYTGTTGGSISVNVSKGIAEQMYQTALAADNTSTGSLQTAITNFQTLDTTLSTQSAQIRLDAESYRTQLVNKYAAMEATLAAAKTTNTQLLAILNANNSSS